MHDIEVLWLDDDSPQKVEGFEGVKVVTAQTIGEAEHLLTSGHVKPHWAVVDLIVPQGGWGDTVRPTPGLHYINHLRKIYGKALGIAVFSNVMPDVMRDRVLKAGAEAAFAKSTTSWAALLKNLKKISSEKAQRGDHEVNETT